MKDIVKRIITGAIVILVIIGGLMFGQYSFFMVFLLITILGTLEGLKLIHKNKLAKPSIPITLILSVCLFVFIYLSSAKIVSAKILLFLIPLTLVCFATELYRKTKSATFNIATSLLIVILIALPFSLLCPIVFNSLGQYSYKLPLMMFILVWTNDTGAYLCGVSFGKHKFFPTVSPKKSWEGAIGGILICVAMAGSIAYFTDSSNTLKWMCIGLVISISAIYGDLCESMIKRNLNIKDSGTMLPGHGGILDRFDAALFAIPMLFFIQKLFLLI